MGQEDESACEQQRESGDIAELNTGLNSVLPDEHKKRDYYPEHLRKDIDEIGEWMQSDLNSGVYKATARRNVYSMLVADHISERSTTRLALLQIKQPTTRMRCQYSGH